MEAAGNMVDGVNLTGAPEDRAVCAKKTDGSSAEDGNVVARLEARKVDAPPTSAEDVAEEEEIIIWD